MAGYIKNLEGVGSPREQAEAHVQLVIDSFQDNVATKSDMAELRSEMAELKLEFKSEMATLRSSLGELKTDLVFRLGGVIVICTGVLGLLIKF